MAWYNWLRPATMADLKESEGRMNATIQAFQDRFAKAIAQANANIDKVESRQKASDDRLAAEDARNLLEADEIAGLKSTEKDLRSQIEDLKAQQASGSFGPDEQKALKDIEEQYQTLLNRLGADATPPAGGGGGLPPELQPSSVETGSPETKAT